MAINPDIQRKARDEIDSVAGKGRLPAYQDRASLPYINAIVKESLRWQNVTPLGKLFIPFRSHWDQNFVLGVAHVLSTDDEYDGYRIPKGTFVTFPTWYVRS